MVPVRSSAVPLVVSYVILVVLSSVAVALRFVSIRVLRRETKLHDVLCVVSLICLFAYAIDTFIGTIDGGIGMHIKEVPLPQLKIALKTFFASEFFWATSISAFRISILHLYTEIFPTRLFRCYAYGSGCLVGLFYVGSITTSLRLCRPIDFNWNKEIDGSCGDLGTAELAAAATNMVLDILIVLLPLPIVWKLQMPLKNKVGVTLIFALGLSISGINLGRIIKVLQCDLQDFTYCTLDSAILTVAEMAVGIIVACVPTLGPVFFPRRFSSDAHKHYKGTNNSITGNEARLRLHGDHNSSFVRQSSERDDIHLDGFVEHGESKSFIYAQADGGKALNPINTDPERIGVRRDIEITRNSPSKVGRR